jgi:hypothetical protein
VLFFISKNVALKYPTCPPFRLPTQPVSFEFAAEFEIFRIKQSGILLNVKSRSFFYLNVLSHSPWLDGHAAGTRSKEEPPLLPMPLQLPLPLPPDPLGVEYFPNNLLGGT